MPEIGQTISHYRIVEKIGQGGMGEVYLADDTTLDRKVALKFLPEAFTSDPERMARFEREAKLLASLNHSNIAGIYGLEQADGNRFLVLEYVEGETLQARLSKGALPFEDALALCRQIAEGLEAAHEKGVIHRDLKPANVMITAEERIKILDFGLAKALSDDTQSINSSQSPTLTEAMTRPGVILGTAAYMSPEQAKGKSVDKRADIWAFGCILYECLTGKRAFEGETVTEMLAAVIKEAPDWNALPETTPQNIRFVLRRCLDKERNRRLHHVADLRILLDESRHIEKVDDTTSMKQSRLVRVWAVVSTILLLIAAIPVFLYFHGQEPTGAMSFHILDPSMSIDSTFAVSPDGRSIAYVASNPADKPSLFVCEIGSITPRQIDGTEGASFPFWSPDSLSIGFFASGRLKRVESTEGFPRDICGAPIPYGGTWNRDGVIIFGSYPLLYSVSSAGGDANPLTNLDESQEEVCHLYPYFFPDGRHYLYTIRFSQSSENGIYVDSLDSEEKRRILTGVSNAVISGSDYLLFQRNGTLLAQRFSEKKLTPIGESVRVADKIVLDPVGEWGAFSASNNYVLAYRSGTAGDKSQFAWFDRDSKQLEPVGKPGQYIPYFDLSPDGTQIVKGRKDPTTSDFDIWLMDMNSGVETRLTNDPRPESYVRWSPDGLRIAFSSWRKGNADIYAKKPSISGTEAVLLDSPAHEYIQAWSKNGQYIAYGRHTGTEFDIYILSLSKGDEPFPIVQSPGIQFHPDFSYNNEWLAYDSNESGSSEIYVISFPKPDQGAKISINGGVRPRWRQDGKELYYLTLDGKLMAVDISYGSGIDAENHRVLFDTGMSAVRDEDKYAVTPDGKRFLIQKQLSEAASTPITVNLNWVSSSNK